MTRMNVSIISRVWQDKQGRVAIWQFPNTPLFLWITCRLLSLVLRAGVFKSDINFIGTAFLFTWAYLEIIQGASYLRRVAGVVVLAMIIVNRS